MSPLPLQSPFDRFENPLTGRYASPEMSRIFSQRTKFGTWRRLWLWLAEAQQELGLPIATEAIEALESHLVPTDDELMAASRYERETLHDVMAHVLALGDAAPAARGIIHLGATSAYAGDNGDLLVIRAALELVRNRLVRVMAALTGFARENAGLVCLGFTHFQAAQPTTVGKRACLWLQDFLLDYHEITYRLTNLRFLGCKGATGTQASFLALFDGDAELVERLDQLVSQKAGFPRRFTIAAQTYTRKQDTFVLQTLSGLAGSAAKFANDMRLLQHMKEVEEPFGNRQIGSSAMPYKRNPMKCERVSALSRWLISISENGAQTHGSQWLERTLDDSANRRLSLSESFLTADSILILVEAIVSGLVVHPSVIRKNLDTELPFLATENILMAAVRKGGDRQSLHEKLRQLAQVAGDSLKQGASENPLLSSIAAEPAFGLSLWELEAVTRSEGFVGRAAAQVMDFLATEVDPVLARHAAALEAESIEVTV